MPQKMTKEGTREITSLSAAKETSTDATVAAVLSELDGASIKRTRLKAFLGGKCVFALEFS